MGDRAMTINLAGAARVVPFTALLLAACVSQSAYEQQSQELEQARAQAAAQQAEIAKMQREQKWTVAGDILFPEGGYQLSADGKQALNQYVPQLQTSAERQDRRLWLYRQQAGWIRPAAGGYCQ